MAENFRTDLVLRSDPLPALEGLDGPSFARLMKARQRDALVTAGMTEEVLQGLIGSQSREDKALAIARLQRTASLYALLATRLEQGLSGAGVPDELPWNQSLEALPNNELRNTLKLRVLEWQRSGLPLEVWMDANPKHYKPGPRLPQGN